MKEWKTAVAQIIVDEFNSNNTVEVPQIGMTDRAVKFSDAAEKAGYNHINRSDIEDISKHVYKMAPNLRPVRFVENPDRPKATESLWETLYFTDLEF